MPDGVHQVRLAEPHTAVDEQRVVGPRRRLGDRATRGVRKLIRRSDDERVEGVARIEAGWPGAAAARRRRIEGDAASCGLSGDRGLIGLAVRHEIDRQVRPRCTSAIASADDAGVVLGEPVLEERVRHADGDRRPRPRQRSSSA